MKKLLFALLFLSACQMPQQRTPEDNGYKLSSRKLVDKALPYQMTTDGYKYPDTYVYFKSVNGNKTYSVHINEGSYSLIDTLKIYENTYSKPKPTDGVFNTNSLTFTNPKPDSIYYTLIDY